jgi:hypothetical protein
MLKPLPSAKAKRQNATAGDGRIVKAAMAVLRNGITPSKAATFHVITDAVRPQDATAVVATFIAHLQSDTRRLIARDLA